MVAAVARRQGKEPTATLTASSFDLDQFGGQGPSLPAVMARYDPDICTGTCGHADPGGRRDLHPTGRM